MPWPRLFACTVTLCISSASASATASHAVVSCSNAQLLNVSKTAHHRQFEITADGLLSSIPKCSSSRATGSNKYHRQAADMFLGTDGLWVRGGAVPDGVQDVSHGAVVARGGGVRGRERGNAGVGVRGGSGVDVK